MGPTPCAIGDRGLNVSTEVLTRTPRFHQPHLLWEHSSQSHDTVASTGICGLEWLPIFGRGFGLRCFQPLSSIAWLPAVPCRTTGKLEATIPRSSRTRGAFPSGNQHTQQVEADLSRDGLNPSRIPL